MQKNDLGAPFGSSPNYFNNGHPMFFVLLRTEKNNWMNTNSEISATVSQCFDVLPDEKPEVFPPKRTKYDSEIELKKELSQLKHIYIGCPMQN